MPRIVLLILVTCTALRCVAADPLAAFAMCIGATGQGPVCRLDAGTYTISTSLVIGRSDITLEGATENASDTTLVRAAGFTGSTSGGSWLPTDQGAGSDCFSASGKGCGSRLRASEVQ